MREVHKKKKSKIVSKRCRGKSTRHKRMHFSKLLREIKTNIYLYLNSLQHRLKTRKNKIVKFVILFKKYAVLKANEHFQRAKLISTRFLVRCKNVLHRAERGQKLCLETAHVLVCRLLLKSKEQKQRMQSTGISCVQRIRAIARAAAVEMQLALYRKRKQCIKFFHRLKRQFVLLYQEQRERIAQRRIRDVKRMRAFAKKISALLRKPFYLTAKERRECIQIPRIKRRMRRFVLQCFKWVKREKRTFKKAVKRLRIIISDRITQYNAHLHRRRSRCVAWMRRKALSGHQLLVRMKKLWQLKQIWSRCVVWMRRKAFSGHQLVVRMKKLWQLHKEEHPERIPAVRVSERELPPPIVRWHFPAWMKRRWRSIKSLSSPFLRIPRQLKLHVGFLCQTFLRRIQTKTFRLIRYMNLRRRQFISRIKRSYLWIKRIPAPFFHMPKKLHEGSAFHCKRHLERMQTKTRNFLLWLRWLQRAIPRQIKHQSLRQFRRTILIYKKQWRFLRLQKYRFLQHVRTLQRRNDRKNQERWDDIKFYFLAASSLISEFSHHVFLGCKRQFRKKIFPALYRKRGVLAACCVLALFVPVFFLKIVRNSIHSLIARCGVHDSVGKETRDLNGDGLLCFNDGPRMSFFHGRKERVQRPDNEVLAAIKQEAGSVRKILANIKTEIDPVSKNEELLAAADGFFSSSKSPNAAEESNDGEWAPQRLFLRNVQETNDGFGDVKNYWTLDVLVAPSFKPGHILPLIDVRWHEFSDDRQSNRFAANVGVMARYIPKSCAPIIGGNLYYDYRHSTIDKGWNRWGIGMEVLGKRWDFRLNGYFPIGSKLHMRKCTFDDFDGSYKMVQRKYEFMFTGFNADIGSRAVVTKNWQMYISGGTYYLNGRCDSKTWGFRMGLRPQFKDYIALDLSVSHDHIFKTIYQGQLIFSLPLYSFGAQKNKTGPCGITQQQIYQPVERFDIIPVQRDCCWDQNF